MTLATLAVSWLAASTRAAAAVRCDDARIEFLGVRQVVKRPDCVELLRFSDAILGQAQPKSFYSAVKARTTSGVVITFTTRSASVRVLLADLPETIRGIDVGVFQNGAFDACVSYATAPDEYAFAVASRTPGQPVTYELVLPSWANPGFRGLELDDGADLEANPEPASRIRYAAIGDSVTHGTGQRSKSFLTYPWHVARTNGWTLYNLGIGGSTTTPEIGTELADIHPDVVTILWGYNDCGNPVFTLQDFTTRYAALLGNIRAYCPRAEVFCITPTFTENVVRAGKSLDDYRAAIAELVAARSGAGDTRIHLLRGEAITAKEDLVDGVHLTPAGAKRFAEQLIPQLTPFVPAVDGARAGP
jgi:lysophospholipase L1-like esterase